jgi:hypothetical protein
MDKMSSAETPAEAASADPQQPTVHEAMLASGASGAVEYGAQLTDADAVLRRGQGLDIVVRGPNGRANRAKARKIEEAVGTPVIEEDRHQNAGPYSLRHFHQVSRSPQGHTFYEDNSGRKARRSK